MARPRGTIYLIGFLHVCAALLLVGGVHALNVVVNHSTIQEAKTSSLYIYLSYGMCGEKDICFFSVFFCSSSSGCASFSCPALRATARRARIAARAHALTRFRRPRLPSTPRAAGGGAMALGAMLGMLGAAWENGVLVGTAMLETVPLLLA